MAKLIYSAITSLDGYVNDASGGFEWAEPDEEVHAFVNDHERTIGTYLFGRRMYEVLVAWETMGTGSDEPAVIRDYGQLWRAASKIVYSTTLPAVTGARTRLERSFEPGAVAELKSAATQDLSVGGPGLAAHAIRAGLVDEFHQFLNPVVVGGGTAWLPDDVRVDLELVDERRFGNGVVYLHYRVTNGGPS